MDNNQNYVGNGGAAVLQNGTVLHGKYQILDVLGIGGFGITYSAMDTVLQTKVAVKEYFPSSITNRLEDRCTVSIPNGNNFDMFRHGLDRFLVEARDVAKFNQNPNVVSVFDFFEENSTAYMVMEYLNGMTLKQYFKAMNGKIPSDALFNIATSVIYALSVVHGGGIIHRDISPDNIYMCEDGTIKIIDFGAAKEDMNGETKTVSIVLKQGYAPIEQYSSKTEIGPWTDIYAFGATLYFLATGVKPEVSIDRAISDSVVPPKNINPDISDTLNRVIMKAIAVKAQDRYQTVYDMSVDLNNQGPSEPTANTTAGNVIIGNTNGDGTVLMNNGANNVPTAAPNNVKPAFNNMQNNSFNGAPVNNMNRNMSGYTPNRPVAAPVQNKKFPIVPVVSIISAVAILAILLIVVIGGKSDDSDSSSSKSENKTTEKTTEEKKEKTTENTTERTTEYTTEATSEYTTEGTTANNYETEGDMSTNPDARILKDKNGKNLVYVDIIIPDVQYSETSDNAVTFTNPEDTAYVEITILGQHTSPYDFHDNIINSDDYETGSVVKQEMKTSDGISVIATEFNNDNYKFIIYTRQLDSGEIMGAFYTYLPSEIKDWNVYDLVDTLSDKYLYFY